MLRTTAENGWGKLLVVPHQHQLTAPFDDGDQGAGFGRLGCLVHQDDGEFSGLQEAVAAPDGGGTNHFSLVQNAGRHRIFHPTNLFLIDADVAVHQSLFLPFE